ncbi:hypothetical protein AHMF7605_06330 [Adhaeribacter arboris]|uniref:Uncharacterized protein n=1 Tax=Adhaeribacter arboris TaxID=2072846 RepID=A0A2T2YCE9_9BACT|nr:hypothetical protein [Adhaeribacter arboris]PSR53173.1 hypothetical protein AHMF7605_06330 [Adhaeribacter arboris]
MEEFKWLFYVLLAVIIWVVRMWMKAFQSPKSNPAKRSNSPNVYPTPKPPATSYQDILKEMQTSNERAKQVAPPKSLERSSSAEGTIVPAKTLEKTEIRPKSLENIIVKPKEVIRKPSNIELARQAKAPVSVPVTPAVNYARLLRNPQNVRTAYVLSEILNRRVDY